MSVYSIWPCFLLVGLLLALAKTKLLRLADEPAGRGRLPTIDGLRGFLALGVFIHHAIISHQYMANGQWILPQSRFYIMTGQGGVAMFLHDHRPICSGPRLLRTNGRPGWASLYLGRLFRIAPLFLVASLAAIAVALVPQGRWTELPTVIWASLALGFIRLPMALLDPGHRQIFAGVTWTLHYEWLFYAALLPLGLLARMQKPRIFAPVLALMMCLAAAAKWPEQQALIFVALFLAGMTSASRQIGERSVPMPRMAQSAAALGLIVIAFAVCPGGYAPLAVLLLGSAFHLIAGGADLFRPADQPPRPPALVRSASASILLHAPVLSAALKCPPVRAWASASATGHWVTTILCGVVVVLLAAAAHAAVERPGIRAGRCLVSLLRPGTRAKLAAG